MTTLLLPRRGDVVLVEQGLGVVRFVGNVDFDEGKHIGIELKGSAIDYGCNGSYNGVKYFEASPNHGLFIQINQIIRIITSEEILEKVAILYDIVSGKTINSNFVECSKYNEILKENQNLQQSVYQQNILIQNLTKENEALEAIKSSSGSHDNISDETDDIEVVMNNDLNKSQTQQSNINGKDEYDSDDTKQEHTDNDQDTDSSDLETEEEDEDVEPTPDEERDNYKVIMDDEKRSIDELSMKVYHCIQSASATQAGTSKGKSKTNQDSYICDDRFGPSGIFQLYGVCDGHGPNGNDVSKYVTDNLPLILNELLTNSLSKLSIRSILKKTFQSIEENLAKAQQEDTLNFDINYSGTTATIGLFAGDKLYVANIGDSRTVLGKVNPMKNKNVPIGIALSTDHDPKNSTEMIRIKKSKSGRILQGDDDDDARIQIELPDLLQDNKFLTISSPSNKGGKKGRHQRTQSQVRKISASVSRSIGDMIAHEYGGLISEPEITIHSLNDDDIFVVFASDGIWQMIENDDVMRVVGTKLNGNKDLKIYDDLQKTTTKLVREANISWQDEYEDYTDDITCVIARIGKA